MSRENLGNRKAFAVGAILGALAVGVGDITVTNYTDRHFGEYEAEAFVDNSGLNNANVSDTTPVIAGSGVCRLTDFEAYYGNARDQKNKVVSFIVCAGPFGDPTLHLNQ